MSRCDRMSVGLVLCLVVLSATSVHADHMAHFKQIGAPPEDVQRGWLAPPRTEDHGAVGRCRQIGIRGSGAAVERSLSVPESDYLNVLPIGVQSDAWSIRIVSPTGRLMCEQARTTRDSLEPYGLGEAIRLDID